VAILQANSLRPSIGFSKTKFDLECRKSRLKRGLFWFFGETEEACVLTNIQSQQCQRLVKKLFSRFTIHRSPINLSLKMQFTTINPESLGAPSGYANGLLATSTGRLLFIAGQIAWDQNHHIVGQDFVEQFDRALANVLAVVTAAGGTATNIGRLGIYVTTKNEYQERISAVGERYRKHMGKHFPAMVLVEVKSLLDEDAKVEIEGIAVL
jgi:enamine deaminase RidA (YjgF/YER057c/UK114 family)